MRLNGYITVEASVIFSFLFSMIAAFILLDYFVHDSLISDASKITGGIMYSEAKESFLDPKNNGINLEEIIASPVFGESDFAERRKKEIDKRVEDYFGSRKIGKNSRLSDTSVSSIISKNKNATILRMGQSIVKILPGAKKD